MQLLPYYTKRQIEIANEIEECRKYNNEFYKIMKEFEFNLQPIMEKIATELLNDKKFMKSLKTLKKLRNKK